MNQLTDLNSYRAVWREIKIALLNGGMIALIAGTLPRSGSAIRNWARGHRREVMIVNIFVAGVAGVAIPLLLDRLDQDPAVASSIFVTMTTDLMGFLAFLGLAVASGLTSL